jgi:hypothetical protein
MILLAGRPDKEQALPPVLMDTQYLAFVCHNRASDYSESSAKYQNTIILQITKLRAGRASKAVPLGQLRPVFVLDSFPANSQCTLHFDD